MIKTVIFDLDDTLYDCSGQLVKEAREKAAEKMVEMGLYDSKKKALEKQNQIEKNHPRENTFDKICDKLGMEKNQKEETVDKLLEVYNSGKIKDIKAFPGVYKTLKKLKNEGIKLFLVTRGYSERQKRKIEKLKLNEYFDEIRISDKEIGPSKEKIFREIKEGSELESGEIMIVGDRIHSEIKLGNALGSITVRMLKGRWKKMNPKNNLEEADFSISNIKRVPKILSKLNNTKSKVVAIGGGTGQYTLLRGLKKYNIELTAIVSTMDNGGSSGRLRVDFGVLPPGDIRNCLLALADEDELKELMKLFDYRFPNKGQESELSNHSLGNLMLTALTDIEGGMGKAVKEC